MKVRMVASCKKEQVVSEQKRKNFSGQFKAKVELEAHRGVKTINKIAQDFGVHPTQAWLWKKELQESGGMKITGRDLHPLKDSALARRTLNLG